MEIFLPSEGQKISPFVAAEINQQVATAKQYPRRNDKAIMDEIASRSGLDEMTAAECMYTLPRAGKDLTGPSIRFAEIVFASFGNLRVGARFVDLDLSDPSRAAVIIEGVCHDLQMNNAQIVPVRRSIVTKTGKIFGADMTNIAFAAGAAIARREAVLKTVPKALWAGAFQRVIKILQGDATTLSKRRADVIDAFGKRNVKPELVFAAMEVKTIEDITMEHMPKLFGMLTALADGTETVQSLFEGRGGPAAPQQKGNPLSDDEEETGHEDTQQSQPERQGEGQATPAASEAAKPPASEQARPAETAKAEEKATEAGPRPTDDESYEAWARAWGGEITDPKARADRWKAERKLRTDCKVTGTTLDVLRKELGLS
jgi:uncharacterized protein (DUF697 family)